MKNNLVTIIIPVYNVEDYITKCIESIINQTYQNLEIICVNDGSTDNSGKICDIYALNDKRIKVIHKNNGGVSSARNVGLINASGEYIGFVDPDDWIEPEMYEIMVKSSKLSCADIIIVNYYIDNEATTTPMANVENIPETPFDKEELFKFAFLRDEYKGFGAYIWNKLFKSTLFKLSDRLILFDESIHFCEDIVFFTQLALKSNNSIYIDKPMYHYYHRQSSLSHTVDISKRIGSLQAYKQIIGLLEHTEISRWLKRFYAYHASVILEICINNNYDDKIIYFKNETRRFIQEYIDTNLEYADRIQRINDLLYNK